jgi:hypothetical protein
MDHHPNSEFPNKKVAKHGSRSRPKAPADVPQKLLDDLEVKRFIPQETSKPDVFPKIHVARQHCWHCLGTGRCECISCWSSCVCVVCD